MNELPEEWGDPHDPENAEQIAYWVWCPVVWAVQTNDPCAEANRHDPECECANRCTLVAVDLGRFDASYVKRIDDGTYRRLAFRDGRA